MTSREDLQEASAFVRHRDDAAEVSHLPADTRDTTPAGTAANEPFGGSEPFANDNGPNAKNDAAELSIDDVVSNIIIHSDRPIENLPVLEAPELKLIGRCVSLCAKVRVGEAEEVFYYTGLVASVTFAAVALMHVNRYTRSDFKEYVARERAITKGGMPALTTTGTAPARGSGLPSHGYTTKGEVGVGQDGELVSGQDATALLMMDAAGSLAPAVRLYTEAEIEAEVAAGSPNQPNPADATPSSMRALRHKGFRTCDTSVGPIPYMTFPRKSIHDVHFGRDPCSGFYALFQDPANEIGDMQYLRTFVRRYLVHTSEGNNPRQVPLYPFVTVRCACPNVDRDLVNRVAHEELPGLMNADRAITKEKQHQRSRAIRREQAIQAYQAPPGIFAHTGVLYVTRLPQLTFLTALAVLFFVVVFAVYLGVSIGVLNDPLIVSYERQQLRFFVPSIVVWAVAGVSILLHSLYARVPLRTSLVVMCMRCIWTVGAVACALMVVGIIAERLKSETLFNFMNAADPVELCSFYMRYECSGFWNTCLGSGDPMCRVSCTPVPPQFFDEACYPDLWNRVQLQLVPLIVFDVFLLCLFLYSIFVLWKLWSTANEISARVN
ncbi:hypothetical protein ABB37_09472 [Leptomonas pyrrhocoris]|uniref:Transmembrane protein n=1 Tax=Leptomonas pyrrhocoris TaxID=157538 RepID=A0A0N0VCU2_LEPPY|nr:hypothetical protein ABB37_09472 [Leptomonas pyrrhocoris]KPA73828.1 hypothetical protein ABB37_09472 [Leptomonas pyrrhocoris]|eukprot:XP_015652267.1 hypothetical protein ABB37_09472 [Leptomonas pyrrhocoris]